MVNGEPLYSLRSVGVQGFRERNDKGNQGLLELSKPETLKKDKVLVKVSRNSKMKTLYVSMLVIVLGVTSFFLGVPFFNGSEAKDAKADFLNLNCNVIYTDISVGNLDDMGETKHGVRSYPNKDGKRKSVAGRVMGPNPQGGTIAEYREVSSWPGGMSLTESAGAKAPIGVGAIAGLSSQLAKINNPELEKGVSYGNSATLFEKYGYSLKWSSWNIQQMGGDCGLSALINAQLTDTVNLFLAMYSAVASVFISVFAMILNVQIFEIFIDWIAALSQKLYSSLFLDYLIPVAMLAGLWIGWQGAVKKRVSMSMQGLLWMIIVIFFAVFYFIQPAAVLNWTANLTNKAVNVITTLLPGTVMDGSADSCVPTQDLAGLTGDNPTVEEKAAASNKSKVDRAFQCLLWKNFYFHPWAQGQFGQRFANATLSSSSSGPMPDEVKSVIAGNPGEAYASVAGQRYDTGGAFEGAQIAEIYLEGFALSRDEVEFPAVEDGNTKNPALKDAPNKPLSRWLVTAFLACKTGNEDSDGNVSKEQQGCEYMPAWDSFRGTAGSFGEKLSILIMGMVSLIFVGTPLLILAGSLIFYGTVNIFLWLMSPFVFLLGVSPGFGRKILLNWLEQVLANFLKQVVTGGIIGMLMALLFIVYSTTGIPFLMQTLFVAGMGVAAIVFRGKILKGVSNINLGSGSSVDSEKGIKKAAKIAGAYGAYAGGQGWGNAKLARKEGDGLLTSARAGIKGTITGGIAGAFGGSSKVSRGGMRRSFQRGQIHGAKTDKKSVRERELARQNARAKKEFEEQNKKAKDSKSAVEDNAKKIGKEDDLIESLEADLKELETVKPTSSDYARLSDRHTGAKSKSDMKQKIEKKIEEAKARKEKLREKLIEALNAGDMELPEGEYDIPGLNKDGTYERAFVDNQGRVTVRPWDGENEVWAEPQNSQSKTEQVPTSNESAVPSSSQPESVAAKVVEAQGSNMGGGGVAGGDNSDGSRVADGVERVSNSIDKLADKVEQSTRRSSDANSSRTNAPSSDSVQPIKTDSVRPPAGVSTSQISSDLQKLAEKTGEAVREGSRKGAQEGTREGFRHYKPTDNSNSRR